MKTERERKFNLKSGMAMPGVMALLVILSLLGTAMYAYSMQSVQSVRFASDGKKAEYLAQAGVEAACYAYQAAINNEKNLQTVTDFFTNANETDGSVIESNKVWLVFDKSTGVKDYKYIADSDDGAPTDEKYDVIGCFEVTVDETSTNYQVKVYNYDSEGHKTEDDPKDLPSKVKIFRAVGTVGETKRAKVGWIYDATSTSGLYYGADGVIDGKYTDDSDENPKSQATQRFIQSGKYTTSAQLQLKYKWLSKIFTFIQDPDPINIGKTETIPFALAFSSGNLTLDTPKDAKSVSFATGQSNMVSFVSKGDVFVRSGVDTTSSDGRFNTLFLKGKNIVIDGDIECATYMFPKPTTSSNIFTQMSSNYQIYQNLMKQKYRYSTVTIDTLDDVAVSNPYTEPPFNYNRSGRVYFGGDVFVNVTVPNAGTYRYKAFSSGDAYYFDADVGQTYSGETYNGDEETYPGDGIDLFRYFMEYAIATNRYSKTILDRFYQIIDIYYGNANANKDNTIVIDGTTAKGAYITWTVEDGTTVSIGESGITYNAMRKIDRDNHPERNDSLRSTIPPSPSGASTLSWGEPKLDEN